jgi:excisionase family DNA binding protein
MSETDLVTPHFLTLGEAARAAGISKPSVSKAIKEGRLSAERQGDGSYRIQPAELFRVYPPQPARNRLTNGTFDGRETPPFNPLITEEVVRLRERVTLLETERERERQALTDQIADLRRRLDLEGEERRKLTAILTDQRQVNPQSSPPEPRLSVFRRLGFWRGR